MRLIRASALLVFACLLSAAIAQAAAQTPPGFTETESFTDASRAEREGFHVLDFVMTDQGREAAIIRREFMPAITAKLPPPAPGFSFAMADLDGDGGPELFLRIHHWKLCETGCPVRVYRLADGTWKQIFETEAALFAIRPPHDPKERPAIAAMIQKGPDGRGATATTFYRWEANGRFVRYRPKPTPPRQDKH